MSNETMFNNELKEGVKRNMLNRINNEKDMIKDIDNDDILKDNNSRIIINNYKPNYNTTNSNNDYKYGDYNYNNSLDLDNCKIPFNGMDNNSNSLFNNKKQISEEDIKNSKIYKELLEKYNNKVKECNTLKEKIYKNIKLLFDFGEGKDKKFLNILMSILDILFLDNDNKGGE